MPEHPRRRSRARTANDPDRYLRHFGHSVQVWPYEDGHRFYLGSYPDEWFARRAFRDWQEGKLKPRPRGIRTVHRVSGTFFRVDMVLPDGIEVHVVLASLSEAIDLVDGILQPMGAEALDRQRRRT